MSLLELEEFFVGSTDACERVISVLNYAGKIGSTLCKAPSMVGENSRDSDTPLDEESVTTALEKGSVYRGMLPLNDQTLLDRLLAVQDKFSEIREKIQIIENAIDMNFFSL